MHEIVVGWRLEEARAELIVTMLQFFDNSRCKADVNQGGSLLAGNDVYHRPISPGAPLYPFVFGGSLREASRRVGEHSPPNRRAPFLSIRPIYSRNNRNAEKCPPQVSYGSRKEDGVESHRWNIHRATSLLSPFLLLPLFASFSRNVTRTSFPDVNFTKIATRWSTRPFVSFSRDVGSSSSTQMAEVSVFRNFIEFQNLRIRSALLLTLTIETIGVLTLSLSSRDPKCN